MKKRLFSCTLPIPPSVNASKGSFAHHGGNQFYTSNALRNWQGIAAGVLKGCNLQLVNVEYHYIFHPKNATFGDTENYLKAVTDALVSAGVIKDDKHTILKKGTFEIGRYDKDNPHVEVDVYG